MLAANPPVADHVASLRCSLDALSRAVSRSKAARVSRTDIRDRARNMVIAYFEADRPALVAKWNRADPLGPLDESLQKVLAYSNARTLRSKYLATLKTAQRQLNECEATCLAATADSSSASGGRGTSQDQAIIQTLASISPNAASSYQQGLRDLSDVQRVSWRGTAVEFREALREVLDQLAPDDEVTAQPGFRLEKDRKQPTMKQKVVFILKNRRAGSNVLNTAKAQVGVIEEATGAFVRSVYDLSSASTHGLPTRQEAASLKSHIALVLSELLQVPLQ
jgi:hypothetical protein